MLSTLLSPGPRDDRTPTLLAMFGGAPAPPHPPCALQPVGCCRIWTFSSRPLGITHRLATRLLHFPHISVSYMWREGMRVARFSAAGTVVFDIEANCLIMEVYPCKCTDALMGRSLRHVSILLSILLTVIEEVLSCYYPRIIPTRKVSCPRCMRDILHAQRPQVLEFAEVMRYAFHRSQASCPACNMPLSSMLQTPEFYPDLVFQDFNIIQQRDLTMGSFLAKGGTASVSKGILHPHGDVAIKTLLLADDDEETLGGDDDACAAMVAFHKEALFSSLVSSPRLLALLGVVVQSVPRLVLEFADAGDLFSLLHPAADIPTPSLHAATRMQVARDVAAGMMVLHTHVPPIVHRDLRSPNVFLFSEDGVVRAKVADFGLSAFAAPKVAKRLANWQWVAPEVLAGQDYDTSSDVFSFGVVLWEIMTGHFPYDEFTEVDGYFKQVHDDTRILDEHEVKLAVVQNDLRPTVPTDLPSDVADCMRACWRASTLRRPTMASVCQTLFQAAGVPAPLVGDISRPSPLYFDPALSAQERELDEAEGRATPLSVFKRGAKLSTKTRVTLAQRLELRSDDANIIHVSCLCYVSAADLKGYHIWVGLSNGFVVVFDNDGGLVHQWPAHDSRVVAMVAATDSVWCAFEDGHISVWSVMSYIPLSIWQSNKRGAMIKGLTKSPDGHMWSFIQDSSKIRIWSLQKFKLVKKIIPHGKSTITSKLRLPRNGRSDSTISCLHNHKDHMWVGFEKRISVMNVVARTQAALIDVHNGSVNQITSHQDQVWSCSDLGEVRCIDPESFAMVASLETHPGPVASICLAGEYLWCCLSNGTITIWDRQSKEQAGKLPCGTEASWGCAVSAGFDVWLGSLQGMTYKWMYTATKVRPMLGAIASRPGITTSESGVVDVLTSSRSILGSSWSNSSFSDVQF